MDISNFIDEVISCKNKKITDEVFLLIQNNRDLMQKYLRLVHEKGLDAVNQQIGKAVLRKYNLTPDGGRNSKPESTLISSYQGFV